MTTKQTLLKCPNDSSEWLSLKQKIIIDSAGTTWDILSTGVPDRLPVPPGGDVEANARIRKLNNEISKTLATAVLYIRDLTEGTKLESMVQANLASYRPDLAWATIKSYYENESGQTTESMLITQLDRVKYEDKYDQSTNFQKLLADMTRIREQLGLINREEGRRANRHGPAYPTDAAMRNKLKQKLPSSFDSVVNSIEQQESIMAPYTFDQFGAQLTRTLARLQANFELKQALTAADEKAAKEIESSKSAEAPTLIANNGGGRGRGGRGRGNRGGRGNHGGRGRGEGKRKFQPYGNPLQDQSTQQQQSTQPQQQHQSKNNDFKCFRCGKNNHTWKQCYSTRTLPEWDDSKYQAKKARVMVAGTDPTPNLAKSMVDLNTTLQAFISRANTVREIDTVYADNEIYSLISSKVIGKVQEGENRFYWDSGASKAVCWKEELFDHLQRNNL